MIREYEFAALVYDEQTHEIHCAACGKPIAMTKCIYKAGGRWVCGRLQTLVGGAAFEKST